MIFKKMPALRIGDLEAAIPIVQGGMGVGISLSGLASAVANADGIGVIATAGIGQFESDWDTNSKEADKRALQKEIRKARAKIGGIIGVNIFAGANAYRVDKITSVKELIETLVEEYMAVAMQRPMATGLPV